MHNHSFRNEFPYFNSQKVPIYLDTAATSQKLQSVLTRQYEFDSTQYASVHRAMYSTATQSTQAYEKVRNDIAVWLNARQSDVVFTSGATHAINIISNGLQKETLQGNKILICVSEHHANILPWQLLAKKFCMELEVLNLKQDGVFDSDCSTEWLEALDHDCAVFACAHVSNVLGNIYPIEELCKKARQVNALSVIDGTQAVAHMPVDIDKLGCDFYVFSGHKMYAANGVGVLVGKSHLLSNLSPFIVGGEMVERATFHDFVAQPPPLRFEAGTPNISAVLGLSAAVAFIKTNINEISDNEERHFKTLWNELCQLKQIRLLGNKKENAGIISFFVEGFDNHQLALDLWQKNIALRYGQHCAMPLFSALQISASLRLSLGCYSNSNDIDYFLESIKSLLEKKNKPIGVSGDINDILIKLKNAKDWGSKNRLLMHLSRYLHLIPEEQRTKNNELAGCESQVWIAKNDSNQWQAYSDSKTVRGLLTFILAHLNNIGSDKDMHGLLDQYGLAKYFSVGRKNGISKVIEFLYAN